ncbi:MAG: HAMP domain-containing histidine kinase [Alistipes sp.]|nr:HAMP domain-containing histidine kinase [Alistipes sp.]
MKKRSFTIVLLSGIFSLVLLAVVEVIWAVDTYRNMRDTYRNQIESIFEEATWQYVSRHSNGNYTLPDISRLQTILQEELRTSGIGSHFTISVLLITDHASEPIWVINSEDIDERHIEFDKSLTPLTLRLAVDDPHSAIMASMRWMLILQLLSIVVLTAAFGYLLHTLFRAKSLEQIRRDLTHNITHELKTPIAAAYAATDALRNSETIASDKTTRNEYLDMSLSALSRLGDMVEEILRTSTEEFEKHDLKIERCNAEDIVAEVRSTFDLKYQEREVEWRIDIPADIEIMADRMQMLSMLSALVDNAIKYCTSRPMVLNTTNNTVIRIVDNGIGIAPSEQRRVFDKFYRISQGNRHDTKGYGLGLYYVRNIVERHGGTIHLHSTVGKGSEFEITLPIYG